MWWSTLTRILPDDVNSFQTYPQLRLLTKNVSSRAKTANFVLENSTNDLSQNREIPPTLHLPGEFQFHFRSESLQIQPCKCGVRAMPLGLKARRGQWG